MSLTTIPTVSIIIPVYNAEPFIKRCLDSILNQTYSDWEAILVDDGATDRSGMICDDYASKDSRFHVIHKANGGVSSARETGLNAAAGLYVIHVDPDDWIELNMLHELTHTAISVNADIVICGLYMHQPAHTYTLIQYFDSNLDSASLQQMFISQQLHGSCCNKLIKRECTKHIHFSPDNITYCEDLLFIVKVLNQQLKVVHIPKILYHYDCKHVGSISHTKSTKIMYSLIAVINEIHKINHNFNTTILEQDTLFQAFAANEFNLMNTLYPETRNYILSQRLKFNLFAPNSYFLKLAISGHPHIAHFLWMISNNIRKIKESIQNNN